MTRTVKPQTTRTCHLCGDTIWIGHLFDLLPAAEAITRADSVLARHEEMCRRIDVIRHWTGGEVSAE